MEKLKRVIYDYHIYSKTKGYVIQSGNRYKFDNIFDYEENKSLILSFSEEEVEEKIKYWKTVEGDSVIIKVETRLVVKLIESSEDNS
ncbi:MAG: hypothetical protein KGI58_03705 [Patescibacteria group bacterium]|nr:hypothetical protein [Patescibacteria group bacterium]